MNYEGRLDTLRTRMGDEGLDGLFLTNMVSIRYLCGFTGTTGSLLVGSERAWFFTDPRYSLRSREEVTSAEVVIYEKKEQYGKKLAALASSLGNRLNIGFEAGHVTVLVRGTSLEPPEGLDRISGYFDGHELVPTTQLVEDLRMKKEPSEIDRIRSAVEIADAAFDHILSVIAVGKTERELAFELEVFMRRSGAEAMSFEPIVAMGPNSALPHALPGDTRVQKGGFLLMDFGCFYEGYCSDLTRTVAIGKADDRQKEVYATVARAQEAAIASMKPGVAEGQVQAAAMNVFEKAGYPEAFSHGLGHGVGLEIHEDPNLKEAYEAKLAAGNVATVEPGAYFEGWGGVRIEDIALVTESGVEIITKAPKDLITL